MLREPFVRSPYNYDVDAASDESGLECLEPTLAKQSFAVDADINTIVKRFGVSGVMPDAVAMPMYGDFTNVVDYQSAMNVIRAAEEGFGSMTAEVRSRFQNDPAMLLEFLADVKNRDEAVKLGIVAVPAVLPVVAASAVGGAPAGEGGAAVRPVVT